MGSSINTFPNANITVCILWITWYHICSNIFVSTSLCVIILTADLYSISFSLFGSTPTLSYMFDPSILHLSNKENILLVICNLATAFNGSIALWYFIKRAKQCLGKIDIVLI